MRGGVPTIILILLCTAGLAMWAWHAGAEAPAAAPMAGRPIPAQGWGPIRLMTANIRYDDPKDGENGWAQRRDLLVRTLLKYQTEVIACQEVTPAQGVFLQSQLAAWYDHYPRAGVGGNAGGSDTRGAAAQFIGALDQSLAALNTIFFRSDRFEIIDGEAGLVLPDQPQATASENTFVTIAVLRERRNGGGAGNGTLIVVDEHFRQVEAFALQCAARVQEKIAAWEKKYPGSGIVLLGDMNRDRTSKLYAALTEPAPAGDAALALHDLFDYPQTAAGGGPDHGTYHGFTGQTNRAWPTDLIFFGGGLHAATASEIVRDQGKDGRYPSDHFFVMGAVGWGK